jgi:hypothetical protein
MKGKIFVVILIGTAVFAYLNYRGYFDGPLIQVRGTFASNNCEKNTVDLIVVAVSDSSVMHLMQKKISIELTFNQPALNSFVQDRLRKDSVDFVVLGYLVERRKLHCSGSTCFRIRQIKTVNEPGFTEL